VELLVPKNEQLLRELGRFQQMNKYSNYDLCTPEGLHKYAELLQEREKKVLEREAPLKYQKEIKEKSHEVLQVKLEAEQEKVKLLSKLLEKK
jgi:ubiquinone biosynthesis protein COQ9